MYIILCVVRFAHRSIPQDVGTNIGTRYLVPDTWYQILGNRFLVLSTWYEVLETRYLVRNCAQISSNV